MPSMLQSPNANRPAGNAIPQMPTMPNSNTSVYGVSTAPPMMQPPTSQPAGGPMSRPPMSQNSAMQQQNQLNNNQMQQQQQQQHQAPPSTVRKPMYPQMQQQQPPQQSAYSAAYQPQQQQQQQQQTQQYPQMPPMTMPPPPTNAGQTSMPTPGMFNGQSTNAPLQYQTSAPPPQQQQMPIGAFPSGPQQYNPQMSVTQQGFNRLWGHDTIDLMQNRHIMTPATLVPPKIVLHNQFHESINCNPK